MQIDKLLHFMAGVIIALLAYPFGGFELAIAAGAGAGLAKELYDHTVNRIRQRKGLSPKHSVEVLDFLFTAIGGFLSAMWIYLFI